MEKQAQIAVVMVPIPFQGHLNQLLQLSCLISSYGIRVHYVGTTTHNRQAKLRANALNPDQVSKIQFRDFHVNPFHSPDPNPNSYDKLPTHGSPAMRAYDELRRPLDEFLRDMSSKVGRIVVIHDFIVAETVKDITLVPNVEAYVFNCLPAFFMFFLMWEALGRPFEIDTDVIELKSLKEFMDERIMDHLASKAQYLNDRVGEMHNTCRLLEGKYIDLLTRKEISGDKRHWFIGPIISTSLIYSNDRITGSKHECLEWLDKQENNSVIYVSFGTTVSLSDEEAAEIALGLERSKQKFIWVLRDADKADLYAGGVRRIELPQWFEQRVEGRGIVVRDWTPQPEILAHPSTGGFMSHGGWNSCLESMTAGVPIAVWPMHSDQPFNAILVKEILKIGLVVREWAERNELVSASTIENVLKRLMASEEGNEIRKRALDLGAAVRQLMEEGGESRRELDSFVSHITR